MLWLNLLVVLICYGHAFPVSLLGVNCYRMMKGHNFLISLPGCNCNLHKWNIPGVE